MSRSQKSIKPGIDQLESREVMASGGPSAQAQYMLELINEARTNPAAAAQRAANTDVTDLKMTMDYYGESITAATDAIASSPAKQPLAWNDQLADAATMQSQYQADTGTQTHSGPNGMNLDQRLASKGYTGQTNATENAYAYAKSVDKAMQAFLMDWGVADKGHRRNIIQNGASAGETFNEVGIGIVSTNNNNLGPLVITQNMARSSANPKPRLLGVVYNDLNRNNFYTPGEAIDHVLISATNVNSGETTSTTAWDSGGYQMDLNPGVYNVTAQRGNRLLGRQRITVGSENVKIDFVANPDVSPVIDNSNTPTPARSAPAPTQVARSAPAAPSVNAVRIAMSRVNETNTASEPETITAGQSVRASGFAASNSLVNALVNATRFDMSSINNWSIWKPKG